MQMLPDELLLTIAKWVNKSSNASLSGRLEYSPEDGNSQARAVGNFKATTTDLRNLVLASKQLSIVQEELFAGPVLTAPAISNDSNDGATLRILADRLESFLRNILNKPELGTKVTHLRLHLSELSADQLESDINDADSKLVQQASRQFSSHL